MSDNDDQEDNEHESQTPEPTSTSTPTSPQKPHHYKPQVSWSDSYTKAHRAIDSLSAILPSVPTSLSSSETPAFCLLHNSSAASHISSLLRLPQSGAVNDNLCAWLYDTFHSSEPDLQLVVLRFIPVVASVYLSRAALNKPLAGFESLLLAIYGHETAARNGQAVTLSIPDVSHSSIYHEMKQSTTKTGGSTELHLAVVSPSLEPHGTVRSTRRARIVGVALELYFTKISDIPLGSKIEFCELVKVWSGLDDFENVIESGEEKNDKKDERGGRLNLSWDLMQPILRILGHCLMGPGKDKELFERAFCACKCLHARSLHDIDPRAILATGSLVKLGEMAYDVTINDVDYTEISMSNVISL